MPVASPKGYPGRRRKPQPSISPVPTFRPPGKPANDNFRLPPTPANDNMPPRRPKFIPPHRPLGVPGPIGWGITAATLAYTYFMQNPSRNMSGWQQVYELGFPTQASYWLNSSYATTLGLAGTPLQVPRGPYGATIPAGFTAVHFGPYTNGTSRMTFTQGWWRPSSTGYPEHPFVPVPSTEPYIIPPGYEEPLGIPSQPAPPRRDPYRDRPDSRPQRDRRPQPRARRRGQRWGRPSKDTIFGRGKKRFNVGSRHELRRPRRGEKEVKTKLEKALYALLKAALALTEYADFIEALHDALPKHRRTKGADINQKQRDLYFGIKDIDIAQAIANVIENEFEDFLIGTAIGSSDIRSGLTKGKQATLTGGTT